VDPLGLEANIINPFTWDHGSPDGSWWNFLNPFSKINGDTAWGTGAGIAQGTCNIANGVQDIGIGTLNTPAQVFNGIAWTEERFGWLDPSHGFRIPYIPSPDWSRNLITHEPGTGWADSHAWSKFTGGAAITIGMPALRAKLRPNATPILTPAEREILESLRKIEESRRNIHLADQARRSILRNCPDEAIHNSGAWDRFLTERLENFDKIIRDNRKVIEMESLWIDLLLPGR
jgi:hypothetical protein